MSYLNVLSSHLKSSFQFPGQNFTNPHHTEKFCKQTFPTASFSMWRKLLLSQYLKYVMRPRFNRMKFRVRVTNEEVSKDWITSMFPFQRKFTCSMVSSSKKSIWGKTFFEENAQRRYHIDQWSFDENVLQDG